MEQLTNPIELVRRKVNTFDYRENNLDLYRITRYNEDGLTSEIEPIYVLAKSDSDAFSIAADYLKIRSWQVMDFQKSIKRIEKVVASHILVRG